MALFHASAATTPNAAVASEIIVANTSRLNREVRFTTRATSPSTATSWSFPVTTTSGFRTSSGGCPSPDPVSLIAPSLPGDLLAGPNYPRRRLRRPPPVRMLRLNFPSGRLREPPRPGASGACVERSTHGDVGASISRHHRFHFVGPLLPHLGTRLDGTHGAHRRPGDIPHDVLHPVRQPLDHRGAEGPHGARPGVPAGAHGHGPGGGHHDAA